MLHLKIAGDGTEGPASSGSGLVNCGKLAGGMTSHAAGGGPAMCTDIVSRGTGLFPSENPPGQAKGSAGSSEMVVAATSIGTRLLPLLPSSRRIPRQQWPQWLQHMSTLAPNPLAPPALPAVLPPRLLELLGDLRLMGGLLDDQWARA